MGDLEERRDVMELWIEGDAWNLGRSIVVVVTRRGKCEGMCVKNGEALMVVVLSDE